MIFLVILYYLLFGSSFTLGKLALSYTTPIFFVAVRATSGGFLLLCYQYFFNRQHWRYDPHDNMLFLQITLFHIVLAYILEYWGLQYVSGAKANLLFSITPFVTALFAYFFLSERLKRIQWLGLFIGCIGLIPILLNQQVYEHVTFHIGFLSLPEIMLLISATSTAYGWILIKKAMVNRSYSSVMLNGVSMFWGGIIALIISFIVEGPPALGVTEGKLLSYDVFLMFSFYVFVLVVIGNIRYGLYGYLLTRYSATFLAFTGFIAPLFAAFFDWVLMGVIASRSFFISMAIIIAGLFLFYQGEER